MDYNCKKKLLNGLNKYKSGPYFMALLTVSKESVLVEAGNSVLTASVFHGLAGICLVHVPTPRC